jgi:hypothetical protein
MTRIYKRKRNGPKYSAVNLKNAIEHIRLHKWSYRRTSTEFNVPLATLSAHVLNELKPKSGRPPALSNEEEKHLVNLIITLQEWGQLSTCHDVLKYAEEYVEYMDLRSRFANGSPTKDWYYGFLKRWKNELKIMVSSTLENARAKGVTPEIIDGWFSLLKQVLTKLNLMNKPHCIFNMDESGFVGDVGRRVVVVKRGTKYADQ